MSESKPDSRSEMWKPWIGWALRFLVFLAFAFVLYEAAIGLGTSDLSSTRMWLTIAAMIGLLLLLVIDRLTELSVGPTGMKATLNEAKAQALQEVGGLESREAATQARSAILEAKSADQVRDAVKSAMELNTSRIIERLEEAIRTKRKAYVRYRPDPQAAEEIYLVAPLDIKTGRTPSTQINDYLWAYSYKLGHVISPRLGQILGVDISAEGFDPADITKDWKPGDKTWNVPREW
jgi:hypothetical protein